MSQGYTQSSIEDIRASSGASIGSLYHHFGGKPGIAAALYVEGIERYQEAMLECLGKAPDAESGIRALVGEHFDWMRKNRDLARFLLGGPDREVLLASGGAVRKLNRQFARPIEQWLSEAQERGEIRDVGFELIEALIIGPCNELTQLWLREGRAPQKGAIETLGDLIWQAIAAPG